MKRFFNKRGMTLVELLVAFTLLMVIIVAFTPMLLRSYESIYKAGEKSAEVYQAKTQLEQGLAVRNSADMENFTLNFSDYISETRIVGRRIPATTQASLETLFYGSHSSLEIVSPTHVPDDSDTYKVVLQATNIPVTFASVNGKTKADVEAAAATSTKDDNNVVALIAKAPVKTAAASADTTTEDAAYDTNGVTCDLTVNSVDESTGKITITLKPAAGKNLNFTTSPIRIQAYFINERGIMKQAFDYLYIDPMTILIGGNPTEGADYFTTAGVVATRSSSGSTATKSFNVEGRTMPRQNANTAYTANPMNTTSFTTATWVDNDQENELGPYYVLTGTGGYIYRMYNFTRNGDLYKATAAQVGNGNSLKTTTDGFMSVKSGSTVFPSFWSGDTTDWYSFQTAHKSNTYGVDQFDNNFDCSFLTRYHDDVALSYSNRAHYSMVFSGYKTNYNYLTARGRRISYLLNEHGQNTFRLAAKLDDGSDYKGFNAVWEQGVNKQEGGHGGFFGTPYTEDAGPVYFYTKGFSLTNWNWSNNKVYDCHYNPIFLKSYTSIPPTVLESVRNEFKGAFWCPWTEDSGFNSDYRYNDDAGQNKSESDAATAIRNTGTIGSDGEVKDEKYGMADWVSSNYARRVNLTSVAYIPVSTGVGSSSGQLVYFGTVPSYALIMQHDAKNNTNSKYGTPQKVYNGDNNGDLPATAYYVDGSAANGTNIYRFSGAAGETKIFHPAYEGEWIEGVPDTWVPAQWIPLQWQVAPVWRRFKLKKEKEGTSRVLYWQEYDASGGTINGGWKRTDVQLTWDYIEDSDKDEYKPRYYFENEHTTWVNAAGSGSLVSLPGGKQIKDKKEKGLWSNNSNEEDWDLGVFIWVKKNGTGIVKSGTNCWKDNDSTGHWLHNNGGWMPGTNCWAPGKEPHDAYWETLADEGNNYKNSYTVQQGIKDSVGSRAVPDTSHNTDQLFYNTFRDKKTYLYNDTDLEFTFGYCSNWLIGSGTVVIESAADMQSSASNVAKSYERFYTRSNSSATQGNGTPTLNLKYNTWFPGEYYNLTKTATLDGVTVACGYTVAGSAFEAQPVKDTNGVGIADDNGNLRYSTALGGIYNDAVLSIYDDKAPIATGTGNSVSGSFRNILYYKSNENFDPVTHSRKSMRFTAVDIMSETTSSGNLDYYAYYADNYGNLYRSKVAYTSGSAQFDDEGNVIGQGDASLNLVENITYSQMQPVKIGGSNNEAFASNGSTLSSVFTSIETITCGNNIIVITGNRTGGTETKVVILYRERTAVDPDTGAETYGPWKTKAVSLGGSGIIHDAIVIGDYYYAVGESGSVGKIWAVRVSSLPTGVAEVTTPTVTIGTEGTGSLPKLYCIAGRSSAQSMADNNA